MRHFIPATRSLMVLMALRATGVSPKRRRLAGVGLGRMAGHVAAVDKMAGMARVRRGGKTACANSSPARRSALRKETGMFIGFISGKSNSPRETRRKFDCENQDPSTQVSQAGENAWEPSLAQDDSLFNVVFSNAQFFSGEFGQARDFGQGGNEDQRFFEGFVGTCNESGIAIDVIFN